MRFVGQQTDFGVRFSNANVRNEVEADVQGLRELDATDIVSLVEETDDATQSDSAQLYT